jgi:peptidylprolyl isomerase
MNMAQAKEGNTVKVHYTGKLEDGRVFDTSANSEPLEFTIGEGKVLPSFEQAVVGMNPGDTKSINIPADKAYGPRREDMVVTVERNKIPNNIKPEVGQRLQVQQKEGQPVLVTVTNVSDLEVTLDGNHPLAGKDLVFDIELVEVA